MALSEASEVLAELCLEAAEIVCLGFDTKRAEYVGFVNA